MDIPIPVRQNGSSDFTCSMTGTSDIVADSMAVSPSGEALSPKAPPASTAPITRGRLASVETARGTAMGMISAQVPHADPMK
ncbi:hypothetical protein SDC9_180143 [bioreactor metagenome]|uniref:Uncharacterized protein n=1 Tax=bioreactor metagenome TaxID=1076179 RepID=A0A645HA46_9ZZZZ